MRRRTCAHKHLGGQERVLKDCGRLRREERPDDIQRRGDERVRDKGRRKGGQERGALAPSVEQHAKGQRSYRLRQASVRLQPGPRRGELAAAVRQGLYQIWSGHALELEAQRVKSNVQIEEQE